MRTTTLWIAIAALVAATFGCGDSSDPADTPTDSSDVVDDGGGADGDADGGADGDSSAEADAEADAGDDVEPDVPADGADAGHDVPDVAPDSPEETGDVAADIPGDGSSGLSATITSAEVWANMMPGGPPSGHVLFELHLDNGGTSDVTGFRVIEARVDAAATGASVFTAAGPVVTLSGGGSFGGTVGAGATVDLSGNGMSTSLSSPTCRSEVKVSLDVTWDGAGTVNVGGPTTTLECVY